MQRRLLPFLVLVVGLLAAVGATIWINSPVSPAKTSAIGGAFSLIDENGAPVTEAVFKNKVALVFFGYTHCPDVCPTTLARLTRLRTKLGRGDDSFAIVLVTVDPERDTPQALARYAGLFGTPVIALTGSSAAIDGVKKQYGVYSAKVPQESGDYNVDHTASVFLIDRTGKFAATISPGEADPVARAKLERLMN